ncbi:GNAT family N-acetyltransferase [Streptomyces sp.]|uniref:GNAT family N-acetyltransferase n=1 Tax=Streptomyces sp. TaxID=1931 RepID=UPI002F40ADE5
MAVEITELSDVYDADLRALLVAENWRTLAEGLIDARYRPYERLYVALRAGTVVGFAEGTFHDGAEFGSGEYPPPRARVMSLLVSSQARREGVGTALVRRFASDAQAAGLDALVLYPEPRDAAARLAFFTRCGLSKVAAGELFGARLGAVLASTA